MFLIHQTHPELADALIAVQRDWKLPHSMIRELQFHGLLTSAGQLTPIALMILADA